MPKNTLYVTGFTRETKAADLAPDFEKYGELVRLDIPPTREDGQKYAFVEYKNPEDCEKALELDGKAIHCKEGGLTVQMARVVMNADRVTDRMADVVVTMAATDMGQGPAEEEAEAICGNLYGYPPYSSYGRGGRDRDGRESRPYMQYGVPPGGYAPTYGRDYDSYGYPGASDDYRDYRDRPSRGDRDSRDSRDRDRDRGRGDSAGEETRELAEYDRGRYPRADSPRDKNRSRSPSR
ncbi:hypothetical protein METBISCDRAFT_25170 [Metschnikowia bicuspidata]|uniref:RRM domain-containing protein n=1 Tax=Metschnikowia bicuspidata TaxID=27322 RepID=A0A4P9ZIF6_9ASCO|nr:hypothetical protein METBISCDRAFT_25170 [Metschnikowia bicuspidata]